MLFTRIQAPKWDNLINIIEYVYLIPTLETRTEKIMQSCAELPKYILFNQEMNKVTLGG